MTGQMECEKNMPNGLPLLASCNARLLLHLDLTNVEGQRTSNPIRTEYLQEKAWLCVGSTKRSTTFSEEFSFAFILILMHKCRQICI